MIPAQILDRNQICREIANLSPCGLSVRGCNAKGTWQGAVITDIAEENVPRVFRECIQDLLSMYRERGPDDLSEVVEISAASKNSGKEFFCRYELMKATPPPETMVS